MVRILEKILSRIQSKFGDTLQTLTQMSVYLWNSKRSHLPRLHEYLSKPVQVSGHQPSLDAIHLCYATSRSN